MIGYYEEYDKRKYQILCKQFVSTGCPVHFHGEIELSFILGNNNAVSVNNVTEELGSGDIYFCNPYEPHSCHPKTECEQILLTIRPFEYAMFKKLLPNGIPNFLKDKDFNKEILQLLTEVLAQQSNINSLEKQGYICLILGKIIAHYGYNAKTQLDDSLDKILTYINNNYKKDISRDLLAKEFGYSPSYLSYIFKKRFNCGILQYINNLRYEKAIAEISVNPSNKTDIILDCGFNNVQSFYRINRKKKNKLDKINLYHDYKSEIVK